MYKSKFLAFTFIISSILVFSQQPATSAETIKEALSKKQKMKASSLVKNATVIAA